MLSFVTIYCKRMKDVRFKTRCVNARSCLRKIIQNALFINLEKFGLVLSCALNVDGQILKLGI